MDLVESLPLDARVLAALDDVRPGLQADGGDIVLKGIEQEDGGVVVRVELVGACKSCPSQPLTLKAGVEAALRNRVPELRELRVENALAAKRGWAIY